MLSAAPPTPPSGHICLRQAWLTTAFPIQPLTLQTHSHDSNPHSLCVFFHTCHFALAHRAAQESVFKPVTNGCFWLISLLMFPFLRFQMNPMTNSHQTHAISSAITQKHTGTSGISLCRVTTRHVQICSSEKFSHRLCKRLFQVTSRWDGFLLNI